MKRKITALLCAVSLTVPVFAGCFRISDPTQMTPETQQTTVPYATVPEYTTIPTGIPATTQSEYTTAQPETTSVEVPSSVVIIPPVSQSEQTTVPAATSEQTTAKQDYASYSKAQVLNLYSDALKKTRSYKGNITVHHKEGFTGDVVEASPGGELTKQLAGYIISAIAKPSEADYSFSGGKAVNEEDETIPILLPQRNEFSLTPDGVASASVTENNGYLTVNIKLVSESVSMGQTPKYNASAIGYLDTSSIEFKIVTIKSCTITYTGSTITAVIRPDGYIQNCTYVINLSTTGQVSGLGITGGGTIAGAQTEDWTLNW